MAYHVDTNRASDMLNSNMNKMANELDTLVAENTKHQLPTMKKIFRNSTNTQENNAAGNSLARVNSYLEQTVKELPVPNLPPINFFPFLILRPDNMHFLSSAVQTKPSLLGSVSQKQLQQPHNHHNCGEMYCGLGPNYTRLGQKENQLVPISFDHKPNLVFRVFKELLNLHEILNECLPRDLVDTVRNDLPLRANSVELGCGSLNLQYHVRQAVRKCNMGLRELERVISDCKVYNTRKYMDCDRLLKVMAKLIAQLDLYRDIVLEHRRMLFVTEEARAMGIRLELLLIQLNEQIRKCLISVKHFEEMARFVKYRSLPPSTGFGGPALPFNEYGQNNVVACNNNNIQRYENNGDQRNNGEPQPTANVSMRQQRQPLRFIG